MNSEQVKTVLKTKKIGIMGGTFNPIHNGHIAIARKAFVQFGLDKILIMPSKTPPHKSEVLSTEDRVNMVKLAIEDISYFEYSDFELTRKGTTYTYETLELLCEANPDTEYYFIMGADSLFQFDTWKKPERIMELAKVLVADRNDITAGILKDKCADVMEKFGGEIELIKMESIPASSTDIRNKIANKEDVSKLVNNKVFEYIEEKNLYSEYKFAITDYAATETLKEDLVKRLNKHRYEHTICVANMCAALAMKYEVNPFKAYVAGLFHDIAKCIPDEEALKLCDRNCIKVSKTERVSPYLLHGKLGAFIAAEEYHLSDEDMLNAITYHTTGRPNMSILEKIVFIADYIEPMRDKQPNLKFIRKMAFEDIDKTLLIILDNMLAYLGQTGSPIDDMTERTYRFYKS